MTAKIAVLTTTCQACPFLQFGMCTKVQQMVNQSDLNAKQIPLWCPLPDHPAAEVERMRQDVLTGETLRNAERYITLRAMGFSFSKEGITADGKYGVSSSWWGYWPDTNAEWDTCIDAVTNEWKESMAHNDQGENQ